MTRRQPHQFELRTVLSARGAYIAIILVATVAEVVRNPVLAGASERLEFAFLHPVDWRIAFDVLRNILLFTGLGAVWLVTSRAGRLRRAVIAATLVGFALSLFVEALQLFAVERVASWVDLLMNTLGAGLGALAAGVLVAMVRAMRGHRTALGVPIFLLAIGQLGALLAEALSPRDAYVFRLSVGGGPRERLAVELSRADPVSLSQFGWLDAMLAVPAGAFLCAALIELGWRRLTAALVATLGGGALVALFEIGHGAASQPVSLNLLLSREIGLSAGVLLTALTVPLVPRRLQGVQRARFVAALLVVALIAWSWRPYAPRMEIADIVHALTQANLVPLGSSPYAIGMPSVTLVIHLASLGTTIGALLAVWPVRARGPLGYVWPAALLALFVELAHAFIAGRTVDMTGFLLVFAGAWLGDAIVRRAGFARYGELAEG